MSIFLFYEIIIRDKVETIEKSVYMIRTIRKLWKFSNQATRNSELNGIQRKYRDIIFSNRMQSNIIGGEWYLLSSRETNMREPRSSRALYFENWNSENLDRIPSSLSELFPGAIGSRGQIWPFGRWITRFIYGINIHRRNWIRGANGNSRIGELITGNEEQTELSLAVLRRLIVFVRLRETEPEVSRGRHVINNFISRSGVENLANG